ncbi:hypothetical protein DM02DRAFT_662347 [Periconia macrospinosa]|uniref:F-box domain-containing protein n=1 Tax=Periconia macrospinosa TaxID=97972 RepID=A0A2V1D4T5_9PLEO|nr:hypothetical protein DM02DRAFT_662347 [Periconia macrospinosa]
MSGLHILPPEIRNQIYANLLSSDPDTSLQGTHLPLTHTYQALRWEFRPLYLSNRAIPWRKATSYLTSFVDPTSDAKITINVDPATTPELAVDHDAPNTTAAFIDVLPVLAAVRKLPSGLRAEFNNCSDENGPACRHKWVVSESHAPEMALVNMLFNELRFAPWWSQISRVVLCNHPGRFAYMQPLLVVKEEWKEEWMKLVEPLQPDEYCGILELVSGVTDGEWKKSKGEVKLERSEVYDKEVLRWLGERGVTEREMVVASKVMVTWEGSAVSWCSEMEFL